MTVDICANSPARTRRSSLGDSRPGLELQTFDAFELAGIGGYENSSKAAGLSCDEEIERADGLARDLQCCTDLGIVQRGIEGEIRDREKGQEHLQARSLVRMGPEIPLHSRPKLRGDDDGNAGERRIGKLLEAGTVAQHRDAGARVEKKGRLHGTAGSKPEDRTVVPAGARWWFGEVTSIRKLLREVARNLGERPKLRRRQGLENDFLAVLLDLNLRTVKAEGLRQAHSLAPSMLEDLRSNHIYTMYLFLAAFKPENPRRRIGVKH